MLMIYNFTRAHYGVTTGQKGMTWHTPAIILF